jgi:hypothetical protein
VPFTPSHAVAAAPLWLAARGWLPLSALVVGTMAPDYEFLLQLRPSSIVSHSIVGLVVFCLPAGVAMLAAWELVAREPVHRLLALPPRDVPPRGAGWWLRAALAVVLGAATHVFWDGFTHVRGWAVVDLPPLQSVAVAPFGRAIYWFNLLQHLSTIVGGVGVLAWLGRRMRAAGSIAVVRRSAWRLRVLAAVSLASVALGVWNGWRWGTPTDYWSAQVALGRAAVGGLAGMLAAMLAYSLWARRAAPGSRS